MHFNGVWMNMYKAADFIINILNKAMRNFFIEGLNSLGIECKSNSQNINKIILLYSNSHSLKVKVSKVGDCS